MRVVVYPADTSGCGHHRLIWPSELLRAQGHDVTVVTPEKRAVTLVVDRDDVVRDVQVAAGTDVVIFQRVTHAFISQAVSVLRSKGVAVIIDVDDDLTAIHPANPAYESIHPTRYGTTRNGTRHLHSWHFMTEACRRATLVTASTPLLLNKYAAHGRGVLLPNFLADHYYPHGASHRDSDLLGWPASLHSHPNDPQVVGNAIARLTSAERPLRVFSRPEGVRAAFSLDSEPECVHPVELLDWPARVAELGIGVAPLADTRFNAAKSWLKPLELAACGVPWVGSPRTEYVRLHQLGCGNLADRPKDWYGILRSLLNDNQRRIDESHAGRAVAETLRLRDHVWRWLEAWEHAITLQSGKPAMTVHS
jgi:hypothetical protein